MGDDSQTGLFLWNVSNGIISYNHGEFVERPILLSTCSNINISSNYFKFCYKYAIDLENSNQINVNNNTFIDVIWHGITLSQCTNCFITENFIEIEEHGAIILFKSHYNLLSKNIIHYVRVGIEISESTYNDINDNYLEGDGQCFDERFDSTHNKFENNICAPKGGFIPGYDWFIILSVIIIIQYIFLTSKRIKKQKNH